MHQIRFKLAASNEWFGDAIDIAIDGTNFINLVRDFEMPMAAAEGSPNIAGRYMGIAAANHLPPSQHFLGVLDPSRLPDAKVDLLWCGDCAEPGCWPLMARISVHENRIIWSDVEQPHRTGRGKMARWTYDSFGPFEFDRAQYESALHECVVRTAKQPQ